ncbi:hypothetical protein HAZT_HAZT003312 [Hyalella azteca]|uniref:Acireductone dioxygenase n=1 Tax=Hyalella azteca TaxID=294128 RepID=A0A6A0H503_HYAAZ|nr:hypothetical protein HAZT_HAZT003312 [Hyalella azteca]
MVRCWYAADVTPERDQRSELQLDPPQPIDIQQVGELTGVLYWKIDADNYKSEGILDKIRKERGYSYEDVIEVSPDTLPNYEQKIKNFFEEHLHTDEEIRFALAGSGYFDVRDPQDRWIRIALEKGDLIVLPAGIYHRFTLDEKACCFNKCFIFCSREIISVRTTSKRCGCLSASPCGPRTTVQLTTWRPGSSTSTNFPEKILNSVYFLSFNLQLVMCLLLTSIT